MIPTNSKWLVPTQQFYVEIECWAKKSGECGPHCVGVNIAWE